MAKYYTRILLIALLFFPFLGMCQLVKGVVKDNTSHEALEGVTISVSGSNNQTTTDKLGRFQLAAADTATLIITHVGYQTARQKAGMGLQEIAMQKGSLQLQDVVITGGMHENYFNTISKIDLGTRPVRSSQELMRIVPGLFIAQHAGGGKAEQIFMRGFDIDHGTDVQVSVDGLPVNMVSHGHGQGYADLHFLIPELVKNIDYGKGPYYTEHGNLNTAGYVSFQTINSLENNRLQVEAGQYNNFRALGMFRLLPKTNQKQHAYIASEYMYFDGPFKSAQNFNRFNVFGKYHADLNNGSTLTIIGSAFSSNWNASGQVPQRLIDQKIMGRFGSIDNTEGGFTGRYNASINYTTAFRNGDTFESNLFYSRYYFTLYSNFTFFLRDSINGDQIMQRDERDIIGFNTKYTRHNTSGDFKFKTIYGASIRADKTYNTGLAYTVKRKFLQQERLGDIKESNAAIYVDEKIGHKKWLINIGGRIDYLHFAYENKLASLQQPSQDKFIISPKFNLQYTFSRDLQLYLKGGKGFHSNDSRVVVANKGEEILPAAYGSDLGVILHPHKKLLLNAALWYLYLKQEFVYVGDEGIIEPSGRSRRYGVDLSARYQYNKSLFADVNVNAASARFIDNVNNENYIPLAPLFTSTGGVTYKVNNWGGSVRYRYLKNRPANEDNSVIAKGYLVSDAAVNYTRPHYEVALIVENIFNTQWNEAQFNTESRLRNEHAPVSELHFTPGLPLLAKIKLSYIF